jgi:hypothetical protein
MATKAVTITLNVDAASDETFTATVVVEGKTYDVTAAPRGKSQRNVMRMPPGVGMPGGRGGDWPPGEPRPGGRTWGGGSGREQAVSLGGRGDRCDRCGKPL